MFSHAEEDFDACSDWEGCQGLQYEVRESLILDGIIMVVYSEEVCVV